MKLSTVSRLAVHLAAALSSTAALAATGSTDAPTRMNLPAEQQSGPVTYRTGGIGHDEAVAMIKAAPSYPLELVFVEKSGKREEYVANVPLTIKDAHGKVVFKGRSDGPYFLARLPEGKYLVTATWNHAPLARHATVGGKTDRVVFQWMEESRHA